MQFLQGHSEIQVGIQTTNQRVVLLQSKFKKQTLLPNFLRGSTPYNHEICYGVIHAVLKH